jgi:hypothetical protein
MGTPRRAWWAEAGAAVGDDGVQAMMDREPFFRTETSQPSLGSQVRPDLPFHRQPFVWNKIQASGGWQTAGW